MSKIVIVPPVMYMPPHQHSLVMGEEKYAVSTSPNRGEIPIGGEVVFNIYASFYSPITWSHSTIRLETKSFAHRVFIERWVEENCMLPVLMQSQNGTMGEINFMFADGQYAVEEFREWWEKLKVFTFECQFAAEREKMEQRIWLKDTFDKNEYCCIYQGMLNSVISFPDEEKATEFKLRWCDVIQEQSDKYDDILF